MLSEVARVSSSQNPHIPHLRPSPPNPSDLFSSLRSLVFCAADVVCVVTVRYEAELTLMHMIDVLWLHDIVTIQLFVSIHRRHSFSTLALRCFVPVLPFATRAHSRDLLGHGLLLPIPARPRG
jgi:hypothetical protein